MIDSQIQTQKTVLSDQAYRLVRSAILTGKVPFGTQLVVRELSEILNLSPTPIKSALITLESEGLVIAIPFRGFFVPSFDVSDVLEIYSLREAFERKAARLAAIHADKNILNKLNSMLNMQKEAAEAGNTEQHIELDLSFHRTIAEASRNQRLIDVCRGVLGQAHLMVANATLSVGRYPEMHQEHEAILRAIQNKDADAAETAVWVHNQNASRSLINFYQKDDTPLIDFSNDKLLTTETILSRLQEGKLEPSQTEAEAPDKVLNEFQKNQIREALAEFVGPMAIFVVMDALEKTDTLKAALEMMSTKIPKQKDADGFLEEMLELIQ